MDWFDEAVGYANNAADRATRYAADALDFAGKAASLALNPNRELAALLNEAHAAYGRVYGLPSGTIRNSWEPDPDAGPAPAEPLEPIHWWQDRPPELTLQMRRLLGL